MSVVGPRALGVIAAVFASAVVTPARADDAATAQTLFDEAKALMETKNFAAACPKLEQSQALQHAGGTLLFLALCREGEGKTASAWVVFNEVLSAARRDKRSDRERVATEHIASLTPLLTKLLIEVPEAARLPGLEIRRDGEVVPSAAWGEAVPVDPGAHALAASAPGRLAWTSSAAATNPGATTNITIPLLPPGPIVAEPPPVVGQPGESADPDRGRTQRLAALVVGAVGVAGLGLGVGFGVAALSEKGKETGESAPSAASTSSTAVHDGNASTIALSLGAAAVIAGGALWLTAPRAKAATAGWTAAPTFGVRFVGLGAGRTW